MKKIAKITSSSLFYCLIIINFHISVFGQSYLLHGSYTLSDGLENPHIPVFIGSDKNFGFSLLKLNYNLEMVGKSANKLSNFLLHEKLDFDKSNWKSSSAMNYINSNKNIDLITFRYVLDKENETELTYAWQWKSLDHFGFSDNFLNSLIMGSSMYRGEKLEGMFNTNIYSVSYLKLTYGIRRSFINNKLHLGLNYHWYPQLHQSAYTISESSFYYDYTKTEVHIRGKYSTLNKNQNMLFQNIFKKYEKQFKKRSTLKSNLNSFWY